MTLIEAKKRLQLELKSGNRSLLDALDSARKTEVDLESLKREKAAAEKSEKSAKDQVNRLEVQVGKLEIHVDQLKDELVWSQAEVEDGKRWGES